MKRQRESEVRIKRRRNDLHSFQQCIPTSTTYVHQRPGTMQIFLLVSDKHSCHFPLQHTGCLNNSEMCCGLKSVAQCFTIISVIWEYIRGCTIHIHSTLLCCQSTCMYKYGGTLQYLLKRFKVFHDILKR